MSRVVSQHASWEKAYASALERSLKCSDKFGGLWRFKVRRVRNVMWHDRHTRWHVVFLEHRAGVA